MATAFAAFSCHRFWLDSKMYFLSLRLPPAGSDSSGGRSFRSEREEHSASYSLLEK